MRGIETAKLRTARHLYVGYGVSRAWLRRRINSPQPLECGGGSDSRTARRSDANFPRPIRFTPRKSATRFGRLASIARNAELARINGDAS
jgi:hypothetical protein